MAVNSSGSRRFQKCLDGLLTRRPFVLALLLSLLAVGYARANELPTAKPEQVGLSSERLERIGHVLRSDVERGRIPGAVVVVVRKGRVASMQAVGFRDKAAGVPMTPDAIFRLASMTKPIVTVARRPVTTRASPGCSSTAAASTAPAC
jgi:CubicO group peptidase (beta-lactamase class C family)